MRRALALERVAIAGILLAGGIPARADRIVLKDGTAYEGRLVREDDNELALEVLVRSQTVRMTVPRVQIAKHEKSVSVQEQYEALRAKTDAKDPDALAGLAAWCDEHGLGAQAAAHLLEVVRLKPDHADATQRLEKLGYVKVGSKWMTEDEYKRSQGLDRWGNAWLPVAEVARLRAEAEARKKAEADEVARRAVEARADRAEDQAAALQSRHDALAREVAEMEGRLKTLDADRARAQQRLDDAKAKEESARSELSRAQALAVPYSNDPVRMRLILDPAEREVSSARKTTKDAQRELDAVVDERAGVEKKFKARNAELAQADADLRVKLAEAARLRQRSEVAGAAGVAPPAGGAAPAAAPPAPPKDGGDKKPSPGPSPR